MRAGLRGAFRLLFCFLAGTFYHSAALAPLVDGFSCRARALVKEIKKDGSQDSKSQLNLSSDGPLISDARAPRIRARGLLVSSSSNIAVTAQQCALLRTLSQQSKAARRSLISLANTIRILIQHPPVRLPRPCETCFFCCAHLLWCDESDVKEASSSGHSEGISTRETPVPPIPSPPTRTTYHPYAIHTLPE